MGVKLTSSGGEAYYYSKSLPTSTCNQAKYSALIFGLQKLKNIASNNSKCEETHNLCVNKLVGGEKYEVKAWFHDINKLWNFANNSLR